MDVNNCAITRNLSRKLFYLLQTRKENSKKIDVKKRETCLYHAHIFITLMILYLYIKLKSSHPIASSSSSSFQFLLDKRTPLYRE